MKTVTNSFIKIIALALILLGVLSVNYIRAFGPPTGVVAPNGNIDPPINTSATLQSKAGDFDVQGVMTAAGVGAHLLNVTGDATFLGGATFATSTFLNDMTVNGTTTADNFVSNENVYAEGRQYFFGDTQNLKGDGGDTGRFTLNSGNATNTHLRFKDANNRISGHVSGQVTNAGKSVIGFRDSSNNWAMKVVEDGSNSRNVFRSNDNTLMTMLQNGKVGIGQTDPRTPLDVNGNVTIPIDNKMYLTRFADTGPGMNNAIWAQNNGSIDAAIGSRAGFYVVGDTNANEAAAKFVFGKRKSGKPGYGFTGNNFQELFSVNSNGVAKTNGTALLSDERLKTNIATIKDPLTKVEALRGVTFDWKDTDLHPDIHDIGLIAQEVQEVLPEVVYVDEDDPDKMLSVRYSILTGLLIEAVKELNSKNDALEARIVELEATQN